MITLGKQIQVMRAIRGLKQGELADLIGVRQPMLCEYETGKSLPTVKTLEAIKAALNWPPEDEAAAAFAILAGDGNEPSRGQKPL